MRSDGVERVERIAILQPTFLPWLGWFDIADQVDTVIVLDDVSFSKQSWQQRNRIRTPQGLSYVTVPVQTAGKLGQPITDVLIASNKFADKLAKTISANYARAPFFRPLHEELFHVLAESAASGKLVDLNCGLIAWLSQQLSIRTPTIRSSTIDVAGKRGGYVAALCANLAAKRYLSPAGAEEYLIEDRAAFDEAGIEVELHVYEHPEYHQCFAPFMPYASALDLLLNEGQAAIEILRAGRRPSRALGTHAATHDSDVP
jgi:WbqC-like protein family